MIERFVPRSAGKLVAWLAVSVCVSAAALAWLGYRAVSEWRRSAQLLAQQRSETAVDLLVSAITRDMRAVQTIVIPAAGWNDVATRPRSASLHRVASGFARYPYPETFFTWRSDQGAEDVVFFSRRDRMPAWLEPGGDDGRFPVAVGRQPEVAQRLIDRVARDAMLLRPLSVFDLPLNGGTHQVIALLTYPDPLRSQRPSVFGFTVDMDWVRRAYFQDLTTQVRRMDGAAGVELSILDSDGQLIAGKSVPSPHEAATRTFLILFFDPMLLAVDPPSDLRRVSWTAQARLTSDATIDVLNRGAQRTLALAGATALVLGVSLILTVQAARANARLVEMRSDFVSTVTHELKTPLAGIRIVTETLASGRTKSPEASRKYARLAVQETKRLTRLIDNLLAYARITDVTDAYTFEPISVHALVEATLQEFVPQLESGQFAITVDVPSDLPDVSADRVALGLALDNIVDNAIRYSKTRRELHVTSRLEGDTVCLQFADAGVGIPASELPHVTKKFVRGSQAARGGSGLGLAISRRIIADHHGRLDVSSTEGVGTTVTIHLPVHHT